MSERRSSGSTSARPASRRWPSPRTARCSRAVRSATRCRPRGPAGPSRIPRTGGARPSRRSPASASGGPAGIGLSGQMHGLVALDSSGAVIRPAILWNDQRTAAECAEIEERVGFDRLVELTGNRALTGFTAPKLLWLRRHEPESYARIAHDPAAEGLRAAAALRRARDRCLRRLRDAAVRRRAAALERRGGRRARAGPGLAAARARVARRVRHDAGRRPGRRRRRRPGGRRRRRRRGAPRPAVDRARHVRRRLHRARRVRRRPAGARALVLPRRARRLARDGRDALRRRARCSGCATSPPRAWSSGRWSRRRRRGSPASRA